jgi:4-hydroxythreonine-4-phosphate dehydrogenase
MPEKLHKFILTTGEPAGVGPDLVLEAAQRPWNAHLVAVGDAELLAARAQALGQQVEFIPYSTTNNTRCHQPGRLPVVHIPLKASCTAGVTNPQNASYVLAQLDLAVSMCRAGECAGMVTAPVHKAVINEAGIPFSGHTEYLAEALQASSVVMLLTSDNFRVALATTHLPLKDVSGRLNSDMLRETLQTLHNALVNRFGIAKPRITVLGLNPHAGEGGHLGTEDQTIIAPVCEVARAEGMNIIGPVPADSAFIPDVRAQTDAYLAMYHDQGLPVLKAFGFHGAVNITLGLPIIRTSVDHGTALELAGTGAADAGSLLAAIQSAIDLSSVEN